MGIVRMGVPEALVLFIRDNFDARVFIETGTFKGETSCWAASHFEKVITVELSVELYKEAVQKYRQLSNIEFRIGDSSQELPRILSQIDQPAVIWLDAHHCSTNTAGKGARAPILDELDAITSSSLDHFVLIDDARLFLAPPPDPHPLEEYPEITTLLEEICRRKKHYVVIYDDVIVCAPETARDKLSIYCKKETTNIDRAFWIQKSASERMASVARAAFRVKDMVAGCFGLLWNKKSLLMKWYKYLNEYQAFVALNNISNRFPCRIEDSYPCLYDATDNTPVERHYVLHPAWAMRVLSKNRPQVHVDIASTLRFVAQLSAIVPVRHYDYRPPLLSLDNLECGHVDLKRLSFESNSIESLSCMHTLEHIGLGRYGDPLDPEGDITAAAELARVLARGGNLLVVVPVGRQRIQFNAHRIYAYRKVLEMFPSLSLKEYALIPDSHDDGDIVYGASEDLTDRQEHGCGCFWFIKMELQ